MPRGKASECGRYPQRPGVAYNRIGERSSHTWFVLTHVLGYRNARSYDGYWLEVDTLMDAHLEPQKGTLAPEAMGGDSSPMIAFISSAFLAGFVGSLHCIGMCGPLAITCGGRARDTFLWHGGRTATYAILGALAGAFGSLMPGPGWVVPLPSTLLIIWFAAGLAGLVPEPHLSIPGVKHLTTNLAQKTNIVARFGFGMATGLLPCGLVYAALGIPVAASDPFVGALAMASFGVGTMPALTAVAMGLRRVVMKNMALRRILAAGVVIAALWSIGMRSGVFGGGPMHHGHGPGMEMDPAPGEHAPDAEPPPGAGSRTGTESGPISS